MLLAYSFTKEVSLVICFKVIIRHIIVDKAGISSIVFLDSVVHPHLKACDYMSPNDYEELYRRIQKDELLMAS